MLKKNNLMYWKNNKRTFERGNYAPEFKVDCPMQIKQTSQNLNNNNNNG